MLDARMEIGVQDHLEMKEATPTPFLKSLRWVNDSQGPLVAEDVLDLSPGNKPGMTTLTAHGRKYSDRGPPMSGNVQKGDSQVTLNEGVVANWPNTVLGYRNVSHGHPV